MVVKPIGRSDSNELLMTREVKRLDEAARTATEGTSTIGMRPSYRGEAGGCRSREVQQHLGGDRPREFLQLPKR